MTQELLNTFSDTIDELILVPSTGGVFEIYINEKIIWSRKDKEGFPEIKELKRLVRDIICPDMDLGHTEG